MTITVFRVLFLSTCAALLLSPVAIRIAPRLNLLDIPGSLPHKLHDRAVPLVGGWVIFIAVLLVGGGLAPQSTDLLGPILLASAVIFVFGVLDDRFGFSAPMKLIGQGLATLLLVFMGIQVRLLPADWNWLNITLTVLWLVGMTNAFNFVDSMDGLAVGLAAVSSAFFILITQEAGQPLLATFSAIILGACIGVFFYNLMPARLFLGDAGAQWLGFVLAAIGMVYTPQGSLRSQSWFIPILLLGVPIFDTTLILVSRLRRGRAWYRANTDHTYHRMVHFGMEKDRAVAAMHIMSLLLGSLAFLLFSLPPLWANLGFAGIALGGLGLLLWMDSRARWP